MTTTVRCFSFKGLSIAKVSSYADQQSFPSMTMFAQPYLGREVIEANSGAQSSTPATLAPEHARILYVQVAPGGRVHYELTPKGQDLRVADDSSPIIEGNEAFEFGSGWTISIKEVTP